MANVVVAENHLTFGGIAYFRGGAENAEIGSSGEKRQPITKQNYLEVKDRIPIAKISMTRATVADIDFTKPRKALLTPWFPQSSRASQYSFPVVPRLIN
jgi:hypothetical protein